MLVVLLLILALSIGIAVSSTLVRSLRNSVTSDASNRAYAIAEAAIERLLVEDIETLADYINFDNCGSNCVLQITGNDNVTASAAVELSFIGSDSLYNTTLTQTSASEVNLDGYTDNADLNICWNTPSGDIPSIIAHHIYGDSGSYNLTAYAVNSISSTESNNFDTAVASLGYENCFVVLGENNPRALRLHSIYNDLEIAVIPDGSNDLPSQGIQLQSTGNYLDSSKVITVYKTGSTLPIDFDYVLYSKSTTNPLSN